MENISLLAHPEGRGTNTRLYPHLSKPVCGGEEPTLQGYNRGQDAQTNIPPPRHIHTNTHASHSSGIVPEKKTDTTLSLKADSPHLNKKPCCVGPDYHGEP